MAIALEPFLADLTKKMILQGPLLDLFFGSPPDFKLL